MLNIHFCGRMALKKRNKSNSTAKPELPAKVWRKNLYEKQDFPDYYTDSSFLEELRKNLHVKEVSLREAFGGASAVTQQVSVVVSFGMIFVYLDNQWWDPFVVLAVSSLVTLTAYTCFCLATGVASSAVHSHLRTSGIFLAFGYTSAPILKTLTDTISTDTIYAMTVLMMLLHLVFFNYGVSAAIVSGTLSMNTAMFGSICLASRLNSPFHAFVLLTLAVEVFVLLPVLQVRLGLCASAVCVGGIVAWLMITFNVTAAVLFLLLIALLTVVFPYWFFKWQKCKENIYGPWDEAIIDKDS